ncbi:MAG: CRTAC1 family protein [Bryobacteraceae bacterium]
MTKGIGLFVGCAISLAVSISLPSQEASRSAAAGFRFVDVAKEAGLTQEVVYGHPVDFSYIVEANGTGIAFFDYDNDGWQDLFVLNGYRLEGFPRGREPANHLYRNNRNGTFTDITAKAGLTHSGWGNSICLGDYDNDGADDLFLTYWGRNALFHNNGNGTFSDRTEHAGVGGDPKRWNAGCTFLDYDRDGRLDLFVSHYVAVNLAEIDPPSKESRCTWKGVPVYCGPRGLPGSSNRLYHNEGGGRFRDVSKEAGILAPAGYYGMTAMVTDADDDGWPDIYVACDSTPSILYRNNHDGTFSDVATERGAAFREDGREQAGMGLAIADYDGDGKPDIVKTHFADDMPALYRNEGEGYFSDRAVPAGLHVVTRYVQWGVGLVDFDNDSWPDLFCVTGHVYPGIDKHNPDYPYKGPRLLFRNTGKGTFVNTTSLGGPGLNTPHSSRGAAFGDYDNDGDMDVAIMNMNEPPSLLRNDSGPAGHWIKIKLIGSVSNRTAIGARVTLRAGSRVQAQEVHSQTSYYSVNDLRLHFGLGAAAMADSVEVRWPSGKSERLERLPAGHCVTIREGEGIVRQDKLPLRRP